MQELDPSKIKEFQFGIKNRLKSFLHRLRHSPNDFAYYSPKWDGIYGWLSQKQAQALFELAKETQPLGNIVEIGSAYGRSTVCLGWGVRLSKNGRVFSIDPYTGGKGFREQLGTKSDGFSSRKGFQKNMERFGLQKWVISWVMTSREAALHWKERSIRLLFIDAWHTYDAVRHDLLAWSPYVLPGGTVVLDDYQNDGVRRAIDDSLSAFGIDKTTLKHITETMVFFRLP